MKALRRGWRLVLVIRWIIAGLASAAVLSVHNRFAPATWTVARRQQLSRHRMRKLIRILPLEVHYEGEPTAEPALWVSNHISWLDIAVLGAHSPLSFLSKEEVRHWPVIGLLASAAGTLFIRRGQAAGQAVEAQLGSRLHSGLSLALFPEGTTTTGDRVRTFHGRLFSSALAAGVAIQPVAISYQQKGGLDKTAPFIGDDEFHRHLWRLLAVDSIRVQVRFLPPIAVEGCTRNYLARAAQSQISQALGVTDETLRAVPSCRKVA